MPMLAELVDAVVGVDTHRDTHQVEIALPTGTPDRHLLDQQRHHRLRRAAGLDRRPRPGPRLAVSIEGTRSYGIGLARAPPPPACSCSSANNPTARPDAARASPTRSTPTWPC